MYDVIIVGSGASGVAAALEFSQSNIKPLMLDVGYTPQNTIKDEKNIYQLKQERQITEFLVGKQFDYFAQNKQKLPAKLKAPYLDFITKDIDFFKIKQSNYNAITSYAKGGLANAWGNGLMRFSKEEFEELPIDLDDLLPYYEKLEKEIGISGKNDDLSIFFGTSNTLQEPIKRSKKANIIYSRYDKNKDNLNNQSIYMGAPRIGISNNDYDMRAKCKYDNLEFWQPDHNSFYAPQMTLNKLLSQGKVEYKDKLFVDKWQEKDGIIEVIAYDIDSKKETIFQTKKLLLASGTLNTSRIVLKSKEDYKTKLSFMDNPAIQFPIFFPTLIGDALEVDSFGLTQLNLIYKSELLDKNVIGAIVEITSPMRNEFFDKFPFGIEDNIKFIKYVLPAMMACQVFLPSLKELKADLSLLENGDVTLEGENHAIPQKLITEATTQLRKLGLLTFESFAVKVSNGNGIHYGGTLPMTQTPTSAYETTLNGELNENKGIYIVDGSCFGNIPATNYSLSVMANSMRIAKHVSKEL